MENVFDVCGVFEYLEWVIECLLYVDDGGVVEDVVEVVGKKEWCDVVVVVDVVFYELYVVVVYGYFC